MKKTFLLLLCGGSLLTSCINESKKNEITVADSSQVKKNSPTLDSATKAANMMAFATPGAMHKMMASWDGNWTATIKFWINPELPPDSMVSVSVNKMINNEF